MTGPYDDIIGLSHHVSASRPRMSNANRAAQFSPFSALTGYDAAIAETARLTDQRIELSETAIAALNDRLALLAGRLAERPEVSVCYFRLDEKKDGGAYVTALGRLKRIDEAERVMVLAGGERIPIEDILEVDSPVLP